MIATHDKLNHLYIESDAESSRQKTTPLVPNLRVLTPTRGRQSLTGGGKEFLSLRAVRKPFLKI